jgi:indoleacetamide hydrolase
MFSRRGFIETGTAFVVAELAGCGPGSTAKSPESAMSLSASEAIRRMKAGDMTSESYAETLIESAEKEARLNAFITLDRARVLEAARSRDALRRDGKSDGLLHGLPVAIKDVINTAGIRTTYATASLKGHVPSKNAAIVDRILSAGAVILGKTNCDELSYGNGSVSSAFGAVKNPFNLGAITGGSSGGSAAVVGAHAVPVALGADTTGSIRMPAALCGAKGLRPSMGRYPGAGIWPISTTMDASGPIARFVEDLMLFDRVLSEDTSEFPRVGLSGLRLGVPRKHFFDRSNDTEMLAVVEKALSALRDAGAVLIEADFPDTSLFDPSRVAYPLLTAETEASMNAFIAATGIPLTLKQVYEQFTPGVKGWFDQGVFTDPPAFDLKKALSDRQILIAAYKEYFSKNSVDLLVVPATPFTAPRIDQAKIRFNNEEVAPLDVIENSTAVGSVVGNPGVTIPVGKANRGLPVSLLFEALSGNDRRLLAAAKSIEPVFAGALL